jgi:putative Mg2+ transporter-C (MgtC) family protein
MMSLPMSQPIPLFALRVGTALVIGGIIGLERQWRQRMAGTRTNALVGAAAAMFVLAGEAMKGDTSTPGRIAAQIVSGIGFLGAGVIFKEGIAVHGLNTAATIWCSAAIGVLCGMGQFLEAVVGGTVVLITNIALRPLAYKFHPHQPPRGDQAVTYHLAIICDSQQEPEIRQRIMSKLRNTELTLDGLQSEATQEPSTVRLSATVHCVGRKDEVIEDLVKILSSDFTVSSSSWTADAQSIE